MNELALFAGAGGGLLATQHLLGHRTVCYVEIDAYCIEVLKARIRDGLLDDAPIWDDARTFDGRPWRGCVDLVTAGFPCQPFSVAGRRRGADDERNMWPETIRIIREVGPGWCLLENVPGLLAHEYYGTILGDLAESGFDVRWKVLSAAEVGAPHRRDRLWIVAHASSNRWLARDRRGTAGTSHVGYASGPPTDVHTTEGRPRDTVGESSSWWDVEPVDVDRVVDGVAHRVDRLRALGNGQVPLVAATAWRLLSGRDQTQDR